MSSPIRRTVLTGGALLVLAASMLNSAHVSAAPLIQSGTCPIVSDAAVSAVVGTGVRVDPFMVVVNGADTQCLFEGSGITDGILVGRYGGFFGSEGVQPFRQGQQRIELLLPRGAEVDLTPVDGIGDAAAWATARDASAAPDALGRLLVRLGADAYVLGVPNGPDALNTARALAAVVLGSPAR